MSNTTRTRQTRRDRRKAKQSNFRRQPKKAGRVGHGTSLTDTITATARHCGKEKSPEGPRIVFESSADKDRIKALEAEKNEAVRLMKHEQRRYAKLERAYKHQVGTGPDEVLKLRQDSTRKSEEIRRLTRLVETLSSKIRDLRGGCDD